MKRVIILDTSVLCVWLNVPNMANCGPHDAQWDRAKVEARINEGIKEKALFVLPLATLIETGNHIAQTSHSRKNLAESLAELMRKSADRRSPWAAFSDQSILWEPNNLKALADTWPMLAAQKITIGDATIKNVAELYNQMGYATEILTGDQGLKAYEPVAPIVLPRRRRRR